jgi:hypothetical protein
MVSLPLEKGTELAIATKKKHDATGGREVGLVAILYVGTSQTRLHHVHNQNFKPAAPASGDKIINKRRFSSLVACGRSLAGVKTDVGPFNRRQHMEVTTNAGEWVRANAYYHNMEQRIRGLQYWLRRWVAANRQKIAVKWCASGAGIGAGCGQGMLIA